MNMANFINDFITFLALILITIYYIKTKGVLDNMIPYRDITLEDKPIFDDYFSLREFENSEFTFTNLYVWRHHYSLNFAVVDDYLCMIGRYRNRYPILFPPIGDMEDENFAKVFLKIIGDFERRGCPVIVKSITEPIKESIDRFLPDLLHYKPDPNNYDYVYLSNDLIHLKGKKFHKKRNHINKFLKKYDYIYEEIGDHNIEECIKAELEWFNARGRKKGLEEEKAAIIEALNNFSALKLQGGALRIDGNIQAFAIGELLNSNMAVIHFEKGNIAYDGIYAMINQQFTKNAFSHVEYINREEDMGIPGLRKAKRSYNPVKMITKYTGLLKTERMKYR